MCQSRRTQCKIVGCAGDPGALTKTTETPPKECDCTCHAGMFSVANMCCQSLSPFGGKQIGNGRNTVSRVLFRRRELTEPH